MTGTRAPERKIPPRLYLFSTFFFPGAAGLLRKSRRLFLSLSFTPSALLFPLHFLVPRRSPPSSLSRCATLSLSVSIFIPFPFFAPRTPAIPPSLPPRDPLFRSHFVFASKCGIQQGFHAACGGAESAPVCRYARGPARGGASGK